MRQVWMMVTQRNISRVKRMIGFSSLLLLCGNAISAQAQTSDTIQPAANSSSASAAESYRTFKLSEMASQLDADDIQTVLRNMIPHARIYYAASSNAIAVRANPEEMQLAATIVASLDKARKSYRLTYTLIRTGTGGANKTLHETMTIGAHGKTEMNSGDRVPILTTVTDKSGQSSQVQYIDLGLRIQASLEGTGQGLCLHSKIEQSSIAQERSGAAQDPEIRQVSLDERTPIAEGKSISLGSLDISDSGQHLDVSVQVEALP